MPSTVGSIPTHFRHSLALVSGVAGHQFHASRLRLLADVIDSRKRFATRFRSEI
jgi:hypothetical protein